MKNFTKRPALLLALSVLFCPQLRAERPNVIVFFVDDLGWTDLGCFGSDLYETPAIDRLAAGGVRFTQAYAACTVCSPSRAALMTGKYPARLHVTDFIPGHAIENTPLTMPDWTQRLELEEVTIAELLQQAGYRTAHLGKWHLTPRDRAADPNSDGHYPEFYPERQGFEFNFGGCERGAPASYFWPYGRGTSLAQRRQNNTFRTIPAHAHEDKNENTYLTDHLAEQAVRLITEFDQDPFFISYAFYNVHTPLQGRPDLVRKYRKKLQQNPGTRHSNPVYAAMVESVDQAVHRVLQQLEQQGVAEQTLVILTSDNGGLTRVTSNHPLRQGKGSIYEAGVRVPAIVSWPGIAAPGTVCSEPVITMDFFSTILDASGLNLPDALQETIDGVSLLPLLRSPETAVLDREALYWHYPHYHMFGGIPYSAVRAGPWKLIERHDQAPLELYNLADDVHEDHNLASQQPDRARQLQRQLHAWRESVGAQMPVKNPAYDAASPTGRSGASRFVPMSPVRE